MRRRLSRALVVVVAALALVGGAGAGLGPVAHAQTPDAAPAGEPLVPDAAGLPTEELEVTLTREGACRWPATSPAPGPRARGCGCT